LIIVEAGHVRDLPAVPGRVRGCPCAASRRRTQPPLGPIHRRNPCREVGPPVSDGGADHRAFRGTGSGARNALVTSPRPRGRGDFTRPRRAASLRMRWVDSVGSWRSGAFSLPRWVCRETGFVRGRIRIFSARRGWKRRTRAAPGCVRLRPFCAAGLAGGRDRNSGIVRYSHASRNAGRGRDSSEKIKYKQMISRFMVSRITSIISIDRHQKNPRFGAVLVAGMGAAVLPA